MHVSHHENQSNEIDTLRMEQKFLKQTIETQALQFKEKLEQI